jgi:hypothetical protein
MTIDTKYELNQILYFMSEDKICQARVVKVLAEKRIVIGGYTETKTMYQFPDSKIIDEKRLFESKKELIESL